MVSRGFKFFRSREEEWVKKDRVPTGVVVVTPVLVAVHAGEVALPWLSGEGEFLVCGGDGTGAGTSGLFEAKELA